jgi:cysteinyl-tRNA synthetase
MEANDTLFLYNSINRKKEQFEPLNAPLVGLYVCGPTVYGDAHLGHARSAITFDIVFRYLTHLGYKVRYVRNITDVGHLENDADEGEDKIAKKARLEQLEPMEIVQHYTNRYHGDIAQLNCVPPSIEPRASGHIIEQIQMVEEILANGLAYEANGSVYFDVEKYNKTGNYGKLSGRVLDDLLASDDRSEESRELDSQSEKRHPADFALWKKASPEHIMRWPSPWSDGFPGWHLECSVMSTRYLGDFFDIHGGGMDLLFPHHECEIAQSIGATGKDAVKYWMHNNMITVNGQKMGKSLNNFITLEEFFTGNHVSLEQIYSGMTIRFFILQAHYRSTLDFSNEALQAAEKGFKRLMNAVDTLKELKAGDSSSFDVAALKAKCDAAMNDDFNTPILISHLFDGVRFINSVKAGQASITANDLEVLQKLFNEMTLNVLGLKEEATAGGENNQLTDGLMSTILELRKQAKENKDYATADTIRDHLTALNVVVKDTSDGTEWSFEG